MPSKKEREQIRSILNAAGTGTADLPPGIDLETNNQTSTSQNDLFEGIVKYYDDQHTKLLLGQTMTTEDGSSRSQAEVHERTQESILDSDAKFLLDVLNYEMFEMLPAFGIAQNGKWQYMESATTKASQSVDLDLKIKELGYNFTPEYIAEKYNLPKPTENVNSNIEQPAV
jgi:phage gp29-like protein